MSNPHSADASFLGYYFQGMYALVKLLEAGDFDKVSIETEDDVTLKDPKEKKMSLYQLKHSLDAKGSLTVKNDGLWKTIRIWSKVIKENESDEDTFFIFVTPLSIGKENCLIKLSEERNDRKDVVDSLLEEASRVMEEREIAKREKANLKGEKEITIPYSTKFPGCEAFLSLTDNQRTNLVNKMTIHPNSFNIKTVNEEVEKRIKNTVPIKIRKLLIERLIEWWDRRVVLGLLNESPREIKKIELVQEISNIINSLKDDTLPDDFSSKDEEVDITAELGGIMETQIDLVKGGPPRKRRAAVARWKARNQRERWIDDELSNILELNKLDKQLINAWKDRFEVMQYDLEDCADDELCISGRDLLDWSHLKANREIVPIRTNWSQPFLVQGSYQQLADEMKVGWHPNYEKKINVVDIKEPEDGETK